MIAGVLPRMRRRTFFYLIQDYEPGFQPWSSDYSIALETYDMDIIPVINSASLAQYLVESRSGRFADPEFRSRILTFEPAIERRFFYHEPDTGERKRRLLFYARPTIAKRNLFEVGLSALIKVAARGVFPPDRWSLHFIGENLPETTIGNGVTIRPFPWLDFAAYARLMRTSDILLSLMLSPHPSYAPLEMAACGGIVVTNSFACKTQELLNGYSSNILAPPPFPRAIAETLERAAAISASGAGAGVTLSLPFTWQEAFAPILPSLKSIWEKLA
jgi:O-antigen biosynthesis protein